MLLFSIFGFAFIYRLFASAFVIDWWYLTDRPGDAKTISRLDSFFVPGWWVFMLLTYGTLWFISRHPRMLHSPFSRPSAMQSSQSPASPSLWPPPLRPTPSSHGTDRMAPSHEPLTDSPWADYSKSYYPYPKHPKRKETMRGAKMSTSITRIKSPTPR
jgi:hypothetical protein